MADLLDIGLNSRHIGVLRRYNGTTHEFIFAQDYIEDDHRPILSLSFKGRQGGLVPPARTTQRLPSFFSNLLPEGHLRRYLAEQAKTKGHREFDLLAALGQDLPGAVTAQVFDSSPVDTPASASASAKDDSEVLRYSLAGVQLKFSSILEARGGLTIPAHGVGGSWIVKMPSAQIQHIPENEFLMLRLARAIGLDVPENKLVDVKDVVGIPEGIGEFQGKALAVRRFDRTDEGGRIHMEDFAQIFGKYAGDKYEGRSYANIARVLVEEVGDTGVAEFLQRLAFTVLIGNGDMHLKNWSVVYTDGRTPSLSPGYDFVSTIIYMPVDSLGLSFGGSKDINEITLNQLRRFSETSDVPTSVVITNVVQATEKTVSAWRDLAEKDVLPNDMLAKIDVHIHQVANSVSAFSPRLQMP